MRVQRWALMTAALAAPRLLLAVALPAGTGSAATIVSILPMSRDFGHTVVHAPNAQGFTVVFSTPNQADSLRTGIAGPDAGVFSLSSAPAPAPGTSRILAPRHLQLQADSPRSLTT